MIKRMNKLTALMVTATAAASILPTATAASAATKLETQEASFDSVQAFNGGKYVFDGYRTDDQDSATYFFNGSKDIEIEDVDGEDFTKFGKSFLNFENSDETLFNLETGKADEDTVEDKIAYMQTKFNTSVFKKADRYEGKKLSEITLDKQINANQFGDVWFEYGFDSTPAGYISLDGKYIDVNETANITFYDSENGNKKYTFDDMTDEKDGFSLKAGKTLFADADYIYRVVEVTKDSSTKQLYIQKISKAQGEKVDGAYIPKSVASYAISSDDLDTIENATEVRVIKGSIHVVEFNSNKLTIKKFDLLRERDTDNGINDRVNKVKIDDKYDDIEDESAYDFDIDVDGNVWVLYKGNIQKVVNGKLETKYTTDRTMDQISVYDEDDIVVWNVEDDIFATVAGKVESEDNTTPGDKEEIKAGWVKNSDGTWSYNKADGSKAIGWLNLNGTWYYLDANGIMKTGWLNLNGTWYYLESSGAMKTGWLNLNGTWYYLQSSGAMKTGWLNDNGTWYYLNASGAMLSNTTVGGYRLGANGAWIR